MKFIAAFCLVTSFIYAAQHAKKPLENSSAQSSVNSGMALQSKDSLQSEYSQGARFESGNGWDCSFQLDFNYMQATQSQMDIANKRSRVSPFYPAYPNSLGPVIEQEFAYKPGFQVGVNLNIPSDQFILGANYLWYRGETNVFKQAEGNDYYQFPYMPAEYNTFFATVISKWNLSMDLLDLAASRPFYSGTRIVLTPSCGLRAAWIRQGIDIGGKQVTNLSNFIQFTGKSKSWAIGPRLGTSANCLLDKGFSLFADMYASVLYTRYTKLSTYAIETITNRPSFATLSSYGCLRPVFDLGLGLSWGHYWKSNSYYLNLNASYNFSAFFQQNMIFSASAAAQSERANSLAGNLYLQGLTLGTSFLF